MHAPNAPLCDLNINYHNWFSLKPGANCFNEMKTKLQKFRKMSRRWSFRHKLKESRLGTSLFNCCPFQACQEILYRSCRGIFSLWIWISKNKFTFSLLFLLIFMTVPWRQFSLYKVYNIFRGVKPKTTEKIVIGLVNCAGGPGVYGRGKNETRAMQAASEEPLTLIKSVLISAKVSKAPQVDFHILTDSWKLTTTMQEKLDRLNEAIAKDVRMTIYFYNVFDGIPPGHERDFVDNSRRCGYVRIFLPNILPPHITEILYLDTDVVITGNILKIWKNFKKNVTSDKELSPPILAGLVQNSEVFGKTFLNIYKSNFQNIPHVPPRGVNSGVMFMNLDAMRAFDWTAKLIKIFKERRDSLKGDQQLINVLFHDNLEKLSIFPCQYNFQHLHCELGLSCKKITTDPGGIQVMHGAGGMFHARGRSHSRVFQAFREFNLKFHDKAVEELYKPLRKFYAKLTGGRATCYGSIGKYLFKEMVGND